MKQRYELKIKYRGITGGIFTNFTLKEINKIIKNGAFPLFTSYEIKPIPKKVKV